MQKLPALVSVDKPKLTLKINGESSKPISSSSNGHRHRSNSPKRTGQKRRSYTPTTKYTGRTPVGSPSHGPSPKNRTVARQDRTNDIIVLNEVVVPSGGIIQKGEDVVSIDAKDRHSLKEGWGHAVCKTRWFQWCDNRTFGRRNSSRGSKAGYQCLSWALSREGLNPPTNYEELLGRAMESSELPKVENFSS